MEVRYLLVTMTMAGITSDDSILCECIYSNNNNDKKQLLSTVHIMDYDLLKKKVIRSIILIVITLNIS